MFIVYLFEAFAVCLFIMLIIGLSTESLTDQTGLIQLIGLFVLLAWLTSRLNKVVHAFSVMVSFLCNLVLDVPIAESVGHRRIEVKDLRRGHLLSFKITLSIIMLVALSEVVIGLMYFYAEGSPITSTVWTWTYLIAVSVAISSFMLMIAIMLHARYTYARELQPKPFCSAKKECGCSCKQDGYS